MNPYTNYTHFVFQQCHRMELRRRGKTLPCLPLVEAEMHVKLGSDRPGLQCRFVSETIGRGVFTTKYFMKGDFLLEYRGDHISSKEASIRDKNYTKADGSFMYFYKVEGKAKW